MFVLVNFILLCLVFCFLFVIVVLVVLLFAVILGLVDCLLGICLSGWGLLWLVWVICVVFLYVCG